MSVWGRPVVLPARPYTPLAYIEATGSQWIDTGVPGSTAGLSASLRYRPTAGYTSEYPVLGAAWSTSGYFLMVYNHRWRFHSRGGFADAAAADTAAFTELELEQNAFSVNGTRYGFGGSGGNSGANLLLFALGSAGGGGLRYARGALAALTLRAGDSLLRDFRPALDRDGVPGLWDAVTGTFFRNAGSGEFACG